MSGRDEGLMSGRDEGLMSGRDEARERRKSHRTWPPRRVFLERRQSAPETAGNNTRPHAQLIETGAGWNSERLLPETRPELNLHDTQATLRLPSASRIPPGARGDGVQLAATRCPRSHGDTLLWCRAPCGSTPQSLSPRPPHRAAWTGPFEDADEPSRPADPGSQRLLIRELAEEPPAA
ncbi:hypothetical protein EYF80_061681 [Liparis tanakae]|uniref:Uncharacterized protein n=1 Tax=Liparis tanakae TaxID=230148 RepID=A0A4Z2EHL8_9TELE|nr:hypothetical protein EYF80_061681 [Liparis tanakae]